MEGAQKQVGKTVLFFWIIPTSEGFFESLKMIFVFSSILVMEACGEELRDLLVKDIKNLNFEPGLKLSFIDTINTLTHFTMAMNVLYQV